eukprot:gene7687-850_t
MSAQFPWGIVLVLRMKVPQPLSSMVNEDESPGYRTERRARRAVFSIVALAEGMGDQAVDIDASALDIADNIAVRLVPIKRMEDTGAAQMQSNYSALIQDVKAEQQMMMDKSVTIMSSVKANIDALNNLVIQVSETATVMRDVVAETEAARAAGIREALILQAFNARSDPSVPSIDCFKLTQHMPNLL